MKLPIPKDPKARDRLIWHGLAGGALLYFLTCVVAYLGRLGLSPDESYPGLYLSLFISSWKAGHIWIPVRIPYIGTTSVFLAIPFIALLGKTAFALRLSHALLSLVTLICVHFVCRRRFNPLTALLATLLLAANSVFIRATRTALIRQEIIQIFFLWLGLALLELAAAKRRKTWLYAAGFVFGLALSTKIMFAAYMMSAAVAFLLLRKEARAFVKTRLFETARDAALFAAAFAAGCTELIAFNLSHPGETFFLLWNSLWHTTPRGWNNLDIFANLQVRFRQFHDLLLSRDIGDTCLVYPLNQAQVGVAALSLILLLAYLAFGKEREGYAQGKIGFLLVAYGAAFVISCFSPSGGADTPGHMIYLFPAVQIAIALAVGLLYELSGRKPLVLAAALLVLAIPLAQEVDATWRHIGKVRDDRGSVYHSAVVYDIARHVRETGIRKAASTTWDLQDNIDFLSGGDVRVQFHELPEYSRGQVDKLYRSKLASVSGLYVFTKKDDPESDEYFAGLRLAAERDGRTLEKIRSFTNNSADTTYELYRLR